MPGGLPSPPHCDTYRAPVAREVGGIKHGELARIVDRAAIVTVDGLQNEISVTNRGRGVGCHLRPPPQANKVREAKYTTHNTDFGQQ